MDHREPMNEVQHQFIAIALKNIERALLNKDQLDKLESMEQQYQAFNWLSPAQMLFIQRVKYKTDATKRDKYLAKHGSLRSAAERSSLAFPRPKR